MASDDEQSRMEELRLVGSALVQMLTDGIAEAAARDRQQIQQSLRLILRSRALLARTHPLLPHQIEALRTRRMGPRNGGSSGEGA